MCGINGIISLNESVGFDSSRNIKSQLTLMNDTITHRGPDAERIYIKNPVGFDFRRLSIIAVSYTHLTLPTNREV